MASGKKGRGTLIWVLLIIAAAVYFIPEIGLDEHLSLSGLAGQPGGIRVTDYDILESLLVGNDHWGEHPDQHPDTLFLEGVPIELPDGYLASRTLHLGNSEACVIFTGSPYFPGYGRLVLRIYPDIADDASEDAVFEMLEAAVDNLAGVLARPEYFGEKLDYAYEIEDDRQDFFPTSFANLAWPGNKEDHYMCHTEATLVGGKIVSACAIALNDELLSNLIALFGGAVSTVYYGR